MTVIITHSFFLQAKVIQLLVQLVLKQLIFFFLAQSSSTFASHPFYASVTAGKLQWTARYLTLRFLLAKDRGFFPSTYSFLFLLLIKREELRSNITIWNKGKTPEASRNMFTHCMCCMYTGCNCTIQHCALKQKWLKLQRIVQMVKTMSACIWQKKFDENFSSFTGDHTILAAVIVVALVFAALLFIGGFLFVKKDGTFGKCASPSNQSGVIWGCCQECFFVSDWILHRCCLF